MHSGVCDWVLPAAIDWGHAVRPRDVGWFDVQRVRIVPVSRVVHAGELQCERVPWADGARRDVHRYVPARPRARCDGGERPDVTL